MIGQEAAGNLSPCDLSAVLLCLSTGQDVRATLPWLFNGGAGNAAAGNAGG